jgi:hypothetical protein
MRARILVADSAEVREGLLFLLGGGWTEVGPQPQPFAIAGLLEVEWEETNARHTLDIVFEDEDGGALNVPTPAGLQPLRINAGFEVGRPPGSAPGTSFNMPLAIPILPIPWTPGRRYVVRFSLDGAEADRLRFLVRPAPPAAPGQRG